ncbi:hypothetical protein DFS34DRAFT_574538 [Phlyctochytrium arcticum]|nr:hypothetical protein DFS34DRAFT_574538 [Phlyctochytrium arcticum]
MLLRRAESRDVSAIEKLIKRDDGELERTLKRRFGDAFDITDLIDTSCFSLVGTDSEDTQLFGFISFCNGPPAFLDKESQLGGGETESTAQGDWPKWLRRWYDCPDVLIHNSKFLSFFVADPEFSLPFLDEALSATFTILPNLRYISYLLPESVALFAPLSSARYQPPASDDSKGGRKVPKRRPLRGRGKKGPQRYFAESPSLSNSATFALWTCSRKDVMPVFKIRNAKVEDADDLVPMFKKQNIVKEKDADFFIADLLESRNGSTRTLVAEADGEVVGFMTFNRKINQQALVETFQLELFDNLVRGKLRSRSAASIHEASGVASSAPINVLVEKQRSPVPSTQPSTKPSTPAVPNAFCISLFSIADQYARQATDFVRAAFVHLFPELDYCVVTVPTTVPEIPLLKDFASVPPKPGMPDMHCLYLLNRFGIVDPVAVQRASIDDKGSVVSLLGGIQNKDEVIMNFDLSVQKAPITAAVYSSFLLTHSQQIIGLVLLETPSDVKPYLDQFAVHEYIDPRFCSTKDCPVLLKHFVINPLFEHQARWVLEELLRTTGSTYFMYAVDDVAQRDAATQRIARRELAPVHPRKVIQFPNNIRDEEPVAPPLQCNLQVITTSLLYEPKIIVDTRIVVVGGSDVGLAFIERLIYSSHLSFTNISLIDASGSLTAPSESEDAFVSHRCFGPSEITQLGFAHYVRIVRSSVTEMDRIAKRLLLSDGSFINYDYMILAPGMQFSAANLNPELGNAGGVGVFNLDSVEDIGDLLHPLVRDTMRSKVVVYGRHLQAYAGIQEIIKHNISPDRIVLVVPPLRRPTSCFNNPTIDTKMHAILETMGVKIYRGYALHKWEETQGHMSELQIKCKANGERTLLPNVGAFFYADEKSVAPAAFKAINDSCLVFDGRLVVDKYFHTQDEFIYAAGTITKYSSRYQTHWLQEFADSREVGHRLADLLMPRFDATCLPNFLVDDDEVLRFHEAKKTLVVLPGNLQYFHYDVPRLPGDTLEHRAKLPTYGRDLLIDNLDAASAKGTYFRIHIDPLGYIRSMTYLGDKRLPIENMQSLYGMHEKYLNRLASRFDEGIISDFITFFEEPWALPIFYDQFSAFMASLQQDLLATRKLSDQGDEIGEIMATLAEYADNKEEISGTEKRQLYQAFDNAPGRRMFDKRVFDFLLETQVYKSYP